jgi:hypothetical protein
MAELNLLPGKEFEITLNNGTVLKGKFSLWSVKRYCDKKKLSLQGLAEQMGQDKLDFEDITLMVLCAIEDISRREKKGFAYTDQDACDWIEELGGITGEKYTALMNHAKSDLEPVEENGEKKS